MVELIPAKPGSLSLVHLEQTLGVFFIGYIFMMVLYGFTFFQSYMYYSRYPHDHWSTKLTVVLLCLLDTAVSVLLSQSLYYYLVNLFPFTATVEEATTTFCSHVTLAAISIFVAQLYYASAVWKATKNAFASGAIAVLATAGLALGIAMSVKLFKDKTFADLAFSPNKAIVAMSFAMVTAAGIVTFASLTHSRLPAPYKLDLDLFDTLVSFSVSRGGAAFIVHLALIFVFIGIPQKIYWIPFYVTSTKFFVIGAITLLNSREDAQTVTHDSQWNSSGATRTIGGSSIHNGTASGLQFKHSKPAIVIEVAQTTQHDREPGKMSYGIAVDGDGDGDRDSSLNRLEQKNTAI
ncbi:hypothetical protein H2248_012337 [Termitomyces sp. 'cryptogamus']|nr:hypothetical protein H2248_012337 [Termitomyces sp. 'cryptogamus']